MFDMLYKIWQFNTEETLVKHLSHQSSIRRYIAGGLFGFGCLLVVYFTTGCVKGIQRSAKPQ